MLLMQSAAVTSQSTTRDYGQDSQWTNGFGAGCKGLKTSTCGNKCGWLHLPFCFPLQLGQECHVGIVPTAKAAAGMLTAQCLFPWPCCTCHMVGQRGQSKLDNVLQHTQETPMMSLQSNQDCRYARVGGNGCASDPPPRCQIPLRGSIY